MPLGMRIFNYGPFKVIGHGGKLDGYVSQVILSKTKTGYRRSHQPGEYGRLLVHHLPAAWIIIWVTRALTGSPAINASWIAPEQKRYATGKRALIRPAAAAPQPVTSPQYAGTYNDRFYGDLQIDHDSAGLLLKFRQTPQFVARLEPFQYETFKAVFQTRPYARIAMYASHAARMEPWSPSG